MYLLKQIQSIVAIANQKYLHSTMYLLKLRQIIEDAKRKPYLHSTMYLLKLFSPSARIKQASIYIPLCIY